MTREEMIKRLQMIDALEAADAEEEAAKGELRADVMEEVDAGMPADGPLDKVADLGLRAIDYGSGYVRTAAGLPSGEVTVQDLKDTALGKAPSLDTYYRARKGIPETGNTQAASFVADALASPAIVAGGIRKLLRKGAARAATQPTAAQLRIQAAKKRLEERLARRTPTLKKIGDKLTNAGSDLFMGKGLNTAAEAGGKKIYKGAFKDVDKHTRKLRKGEFSDLALEQGQWGSSAAMVDNAKLAQDAANEAGRKIEDLGRKVDARIIRDEALQEAHEKALKYSNSKMPEKAGAGRREASRLEQLRHPMVKQKIKERIKGKLRTKTVTTSDPFMHIDEAIEHKRDAQEAANKLGQYGKSVRSNYKGQIRDTEAAGLRRQIEDTMDVAQPGLGGKLSQENSKWSLLESAIPELEKKAEQAGTLKSLITPNLAMAPAAFGAAHYGNSLGWAAAGAAAGKLLGTTTARTGSGLLLNRLGKYGLVDPVVRASLLDALEENRELKRKSGWTLIDPGKLETP